MKKNLTKLILGIGVCGSAFAQTTITGPSSSQSPYVIGTVSGATLTSVLTAGDVIGGYKLCGLGDGLGAFDNGDGSFTLLANHEMGNTAGVVRAHGQPGAFVSKWIINKSTLAVMSGADLMQNVNLWTGTTYTTYNSTNTSTLASFARFCSADLPPVPAFYNSRTGNGTMNRIFMNGEENGNEGRALGHIVTGPAAGTTYELPHLGKLSFENVIASPFESDKTIVAGMDDSTPGQVYMYIGNKSGTGTDIEKAGLFGGKLFGVAVTGLAVETSTSFPAPNTPFTLVDLGSVQNTTGSSLNTSSNNKGVTAFLRPEDGCWDVNNPTDFYFVTTNSFTSPSRLWRLRFFDMNNPQYGGTITALLDGTEGQKMLDNLTLDGYGHVLLQEDPGGQNHTAKIWQYNISTDVLTLVGDHDPNRFITGGSSFLTIDEETSGIINAQSILGAGWTLLYDQTHYPVAGEQVEGGQLLAFYNPATAALNPEIAIMGNSITINQGDITPNLADYTSFGVVNSGTAISKTFLIQNGGPGVLTIKSLSISGSSASDFTFTGLAPVPFTLAAASSQSFTVKFQSSTTGTRTAMISVYNNDATESLYDFAVEGTAVVPEINLLGNAISIPDNNAAINSANNTDFGSQLKGTTVSRSFVIENTGSGTLTISGINIVGGNSGMFYMSTPLSFPVSLTTGQTRTFTIMYTPTTIGAHGALVNVMNNDGDEAIYDFRIAGESWTDVGIAEAKSVLQTMEFYPNPVNAEATLSLNLPSEKKVTVRVYDLAGKQVIKEVQKQLPAGKNEITVKTGDLMNGEYMLQVNMDNQQKSLKIIVLH